MQTANDHLDKCIKDIEAKLGWGNGVQWTHQDFLNLSEKIQEETGEPLSYITLKRVWGKVAYHSFPNSNTLNVLARFLGYDSWRAFQHGHRQMECIEGKASIFLDGNLAYSIEEKIQPVAIKGIDFRFEGLGAVDDVKLGRPGGDWVFQDGFGGGI
ncbi:MAG: hypothetical protein J5I98_20345 [Phaeodactylibacter sp.]|nr:hypothetical protein [Phaeodactylibacter sp.]